MNKKSNFSIIFSSMIHTKFLSSANPKLNVLFLLYIYIFFIEYQVSNSNLIKRKVKPSRSEALEERIVSKEGKDSSKDT